MFCDVHKAAEEYDADASTALAVVLDIFPVLGCGQAGAFVQPIGESATRNIELFSAKCLIMCHAAPSESAEAILVFLATMGDSKSDGCVTLLPCALRAWWAHTVLPCGLWVLIRLVLRKAPALHWGSSCGALRRERGMTALLTFCWIVYCVISLAAAWASRLCKTKPRSSSSMFGVRFPTKSVERQ